MNITTRKRLIRPAVALSVSLLVSGVAAAAVSERKAAVVPDLLELPAQKASSALHSIQLGIARAGERLVSVGEQGIILLSDDDGKSWRQSTGVPVSVTLTDVQFASAKQGWASGHSGVILHTADGGENWELQVDGYRVADIIYNEAKRRAELGLPGAEDALTNANYLVKEGADKPFLDLYIADEQHGWAIGAYGIALATRDGGKSWQSIVDLLHNDSGRHLYSIQPEQDGMVVAGEQGSLFSRGGGQVEYQRVETPYAGTFFGFIPLPSQKLLAFGLRGNVWREQDSGWHRIDLGSEATLTAGMSLSDGTLLLGDESGHLVVSRDRGRSFSKADVSPTASITAMVQARDGAIVLSTARGPVRLDTPFSKPEAQ
ncbi:WD40/YVTN/BNR-like repeat-containing protein [Marinobacterium sp. YM272]|uniref:WD40/YVTN/BNR-like repeat-containing protein n=1 Tax=Marinobacterium sp. YM272 TaxID=3421654 RepID=UPI003D7FC34B